MWLYWHLESCLSIRFNIFVETLNLREGLPLIWWLLERSELVRVSIIALIKHLGRICSVLLHGLHLKHSIVLWWSLLLLRAHYLRLFGNTRNHRRLSWSSWLVINLFSIPVKSCVSSLSNVCCFDLEVSRHLEISWALTTRALRKWNFIGIVTLRLVDDWIYDTATTAWALTWIIKEDYFSKRGTTESESVGVSAERAHPARRLRILLFSKWSHAWLFIILVLIKRTKAIPRAHQSCATEVTI